jgi:hypothetical protein
MYQLISKPESTVLSVGWYDLPFSALEALATRIGNMAKRAAAPPIIERSEFIS